MIFRRSLQRYGRTPEPDTPFARAGEMWDRRIGAARVQAANWRLMAMGTLLLSTGLSIALVWQALQSRVVPYVVAVDRLGAPTAVGPAEADYTPSDPQIAWFLARFIANLRTRSLDPVLMRTAWLQAYDFASRRGALFLDAAARADDPFAHVGEETRSVEIVSVVRASDRSFKVAWDERRFVHGAPAGTGRWTAMVTVEVRTPHDAATLRRNPLGLYVDAVDWAQEYEAAPSRGDGAAPPTPAATSVSQRDAQSPADIPVPRDIPFGSPLDPDLARLSDPHPSGDDR